MLFMIQWTKLSVNEQSIMNSNLPDEIKKLMIENPIQQPNQNNQVISQDIIEGK